MAMMRRITIQFKQTIYDRLQHLTEQFEGPQIYCEFVKDSGQGYLIVRLQTHKYDGQTKNLMYPIEHIHSVEQHIFPIEEKGDDGGD